MLLLIKHWKVIASLVLVFAVAMYLQLEIQEAKDMIQLENRVEQQKDYIEGRKGIDDATKNVRGIDSDAALEWLRSRTPGGSE